MNHKGVPGLVILFSILFLTACLPKSNFSNSDDGLGTTCDGSSCPQKPKKIFDVVTDPPSPNASANPKVLGKVTSDVNYVYLYSDANCLNTLGFSDASDFTSLGIRIIVGLNTTKIIFARATTRQNPSGPFLSDCEEIIRYTRRNTGPVRFEPNGSDVSPSTNSSPRFYGVVTDQSITHVKFYSDSSCQSEIVVKESASLLTAELENSGVVINVPQNQLTTIYAKGVRDGVDDNRCDPFVEYVHDTLPPSLQASEIRHKLFFDKIDQSPPISWTAASDGQGSGIKRYEYSIGTSRGTQNIMDWTPTTSASNNVARNLSLSLSAPNQKYFVSVRAIDNLDHVSDPLEHQEGWQITSEIPSLSISKPGGATLSGKSVLVSGTCVPGMPINLVNDTHLVNPGPISCGETAFFSQRFQIKYESGSGTKQFELRQNDGESDVTRGDSFNYQPLSPFGKSTGLGNEHSCGSRNGSLHCWGKQLNTDGRLGIDLTTSQKRPYFVPRGALGSSELEFEQVGGGWFHTCALGSDRKAYCWGDNTYQQLGVSGKKDSKVPNPVNMIDVQGGQFIQISVGFHHACAMTPSGAVYCWGYNAKKQLAQATTHKGDKATQVTGLPAAAKQVSVGGHHSCALLTNNDIWCWGDYTNRVLGNDTVTANTSVPVIVQRGGMPDPDDLFQEVSVAHSHACAVTKNLRTNEYKTFCWGNNDRGALGTGDLVSLSRPSKPVTVSHLDPQPQFVHVSVGGDNTATNNHTCAISTEGKLYCWGQNASGQIGINVTSTSAAAQAETKAKAVVYGNCSSTAPVIEEVSLGGTHTCARATNDQTYCWGNYQNGRLGIGTIAANVKQAQPLFGELCDAP